MSKQTLVACISAIFVLNERPLQSIAERVLFEDDWILISLMAFRRISYDCFISSLLGSELHSTFGFGAMDSI
jgi:hypothetical protein